MPVDYENATQTSTATLITGLVDDVQTLVKQQFQLTRKEIERDLQRCREAALLFLAGAGMLLLGMVEVTLAIAHWLHWVTSPAGTEVASLPLWGCHGIVGIAASRLFQTVDPLNGPTAEAIQDNLEWKTDK